jgi:hypothetical protein
VSAGKKTNFILKTSNTLKMSKKNVPSKKTTTTSQTAFDLAVTEQAFKHLTDLITQGFSEMSEKISSRNLFFVRGGADIIKCFELMKKTRETLMNKEAASAPATIFEFIVEIFQTFAPPEVNLALVDVLQSIEHKPTDFQVRDFFDQRQQTIVLNLDSTASAPAAQAFENFTVLPAENETDAGLGDLSQFDFNLLQDFDTNTAPLEELPPEPQPTTDNILPPVFLTSSSAPVTRSSQKIIPTKANHRFNPSCGVKKRR